MALKQTPSPSTLDVQLFKDQTLGIGSFGKVCRARYGSLPCAAKLIHETLFDPEASKLVAQEKEHRLPFKRFEQECEVLHNLRHPNVIQYLSVYQDPDTKLPVLLMELMDGNLTHYLNNSLQQIPFHIQVNFCHNIALALSFLHANEVIHRDLSSNNVLLISNIRAKVTDFGMATLHVNEQATQFSRTMCPGTDAYMPPEAVETKPVYTEKIDCFSFGVLVIQILTQLFPAPGNRQEVMEDHPGLRKGRKVLVTIPEVERRENHIVLIDPNHPLLAIALDCLQDLESDRPSAQQICERVAALKESAKYTESNKETDKDMKVEPLQGEKQGVGESLSHNLGEREELIKAERQENLRLNELIRLKDGTIADQEKEIEELKKQLLAATTADKGTEITQQHEQEHEEHEEHEEQSLQTKKAEPKRDYPNYLTSEDVDQQVIHLGKLPEPLMEEAQKSSEGSNQSFDKRFYVNINVRHSHANTAPKKPGSPHQKLPGPTPVDLMSLQIQEQCKALMPYWYQSWLSREEALSYLLDKDPGWFVVRDSTTVTGGYALTVRLSQSHVRKRRKLPIATPVTEDMLVTHFLIQPDSGGVRLQGWSERAFKSLPEFIAHHTVKKMCLPCKLVLPQFDSEGALQVRRKPAGMKQAFQSGADIPSDGSERLDTINDKITEVTQYTRPISPIASAGTPTESPPRIGEEVYMTPATNEGALYAQLSEIKINFFKRDSLKLTKQLGAGQFGGIHQGEWTVPRSERTVNVAAKMLKEGASEQDKIKFLQEAAIIGQFSHPNIVKLHGMVSEGEPMMMIIEYLPKGNLRQLLCSTYSHHSCERDADLPHTLLSYSRQIASGMNYVAAKSFIHRDLAARNILVSEDGVCKIADFRMSRDLLDGDFYTARGGKIRVKWTAPEAVNYRRYSTASDVWSFGCVMYEIWSLGHKPFENTTNLKYLQLIDKGIRLAPPPGCPRNIYKLMIDCWHPQSSNRPDFASVVQQLFLPDSKLLQWSEEDKTTDPEVATLGTELDKAANLYKSLQEQYLTK